MCAFPLSINLQFLGFTNTQQKATTACLLYLNKSGRWIILKRITNSNPGIDSNDGVAKSLFGQYVIKNSLGYADGQVLFIICYFQTQNFSTHNLNELLRTKETKETLTDERIAELGIVPIRVIYNRKPL